MEDYQEVKYKGKLSCSGDHQEQDECENGCNKYSAYGMQMQ